MPLTFSIAQMKVPADSAMVAFDGPLKATLAVRSGAPTGELVSESTNEKRNRFGPAESSDETMTGSTDAREEAAGVGVELDPAAAHPPRRSTAHRAPRKWSRGMATA
jgi:hypothetical protein